MLRAGPWAEAICEAEAPDDAFRARQVDRGAKCAHAALRGHLAEYGIVAAKGISRLRDLPPALDAGVGVQPESARQTLLLIAQLIEALTMQIRRVETELLAWHRSNPASQRLGTIPGIAVITATALAATVLDAKVFRSGRRFAAWLGLVPRQNSSGGKDWPLLVTGAVAMVVSATAMSWHGITLSEAARLAPPGQAGAVTGGVLSFGQIGALAYPAVFSLLLGLTGDYGAGWGGLRRAGNSSRCQHAAPK